MRQVIQVSAIAAASVLALSACSATTGPDDASTGSKKGSLDGTIVFLTPNQTVVRWTQFDLPAMQKELKIKAPKMKIQVFNAQDDAARQVQQAEAAVTKGAKAIIMTPVDPDQTAAIVQKAQDAGIPIISYAHEANGSKPDYYVTVPFEQIGEQSAQELVAAEKPTAQKPLKLAKIYGDPKFFFYTEQAKGHDKVLGPLITSGAIKVVCQGDSAGYDTSAARQAMEQCLTKTSNGVDAVLATNDSTANGVLAALSGDGLQGKVKVFGGYDAEAGTIQQLLAGNISTDMRPPYDLMGAAAVDIVVDELKGDTPSTELVNGVYDNKTTDIPTAYLPNVLITPETVQDTLIKPGILTRDELCKTGPAVNSTFCTS